VITDVGPVDIDVPRDRDGTFAPVIVKKRQRRLTGMDNIVLSLTAKGLTSGEISAHIAEIYDASVSKETISRITDQIVDVMVEWQNRPLDRVYPVIFIDAVHVKIRPIYVAIGVTTDGERDILGLWVGTGSEGAKYWLQVLTEIKNRGVEDVCIVVCDGLKGLPESITTTWSAALIQTCVLHLIRGTFRLAGRHDWDPLAKALRPVYTAPTEAAARERFTEFTESWGKKYPAIISHVGGRVGRVRAVPPIRSRDPPDRLFNECHREPQRTYPTCCQGPRPLSQRTGRTQMRVPRDPSTRPDRQRTRQMGHALETSTQRFQHRIRRTNQLMCIHINQTAVTPLMGHSPQGVSFDRKSKSRVVTASAEPMNVGDTATTAATAATRSVLIRLTSLT
jgi:putative transposase